MSRTSGARREPRDGSHPSIRPTSRAVIPHHDGGTPVRPKPIRPTTAKENRRDRVRSGPDLDPRPPPLLALLQFPDRAEFDRWAHSPEYVEISNDRIAATTGSVVLVTGVAPTATVHPDHADLADRVAT
jgi:Domain of unknown function (DUF1330)